MGNTVLDLANRARDEKRWADAAKFYAQYLVQEEKDSGNWVQYGHALKESEQFDRAEAAYLTAKALTPEEPDVHLQLGHFYNRTRKFAKAVTAFRAALHLDSKLKEARSELLKMGVSLESLVVRNADRKPITFMDLSDVFFYLRHHVTVSGIQRVQLGIALALIGMPEEQRKGICFVVESENRDGYKIIDDVFVAEICSQLATEQVDHQHLKSTMGKAVEDGEPYYPSAGDAILMLGAFWVMENIAERIGALHRKDVRVGVLIHDIIPLSHPEFCVQSLTDEFRRDLFTVAKFIDFIMTVSNHTGHTLKQFLEESGLHCPPIKTLPLAHKTWEPPINKAWEIPRNLEKLVKEKYVLYVSTIEIRKNHTYIFRVWKRLMRERGGNVPKLVFVGRPGWRVSDLMSQLESTGYLQGSIKILHDLSDAALALLYRNSQFTVFPSFVEGWGLPVGESLMFGRPCIASSSSSIPEAGGDFADYIDPHNENDGYSKIVRFLDDSAYLEDRAKYIQKHFRPREWHDVALDLISITDEFLKAIPSTRSREVALPGMMSGRMYRAGHRDNLAKFINSGNAAFVYEAFDTGWHRVENFGRWLKTRGGISFAISGSNQGYTLYIKVCRVGWAQEMRLSVSLNGDVYESVSVEVEGTMLVFNIDSQIDAIELGFEAVGNLEDGPDPRPLSFGIMSIGYCANSDMSSRVSMLEQLVTDNMRFPTLKLSS